MLQTLPFLLGTIFVAIIAHHLVRFYLEKRGWQRRSINFGNFDNQHLKDRYEKGDESLPLLRAFVRELWTA